LYMAMNGGTMITQPKIMAMSERIGLMPWSFLRPP
jgi:hypothetical protein